MWTKLGQIIVKQLVYAFLDYLGEYAKYLPQRILDWKAKKKREFDQAEAKKEFDKAKNDPSKSAQEKADEYQKYINS